LEVSKTDAKSTKTKVSFTYSLTDKFTDWQIKKTRTIKVSAQNRGKGIRKNKKAGIEGGKPLM